MKKTILNSKGENYTAVNFGILNEISEHSLIHPKTQQEIKGKVFLKNVTDATGTEISFNAIPPKTEVPYFHSHRANEEMYIILKGEGDFQVDNTSFPISEGSAIRVATGAARGLRNSSNEEMIYMVIQSRENSLREYSAEDAEGSEFNPKWKR